MTKFMDYVEEGYGALGAYVLILAGATVAFGCMVLACLAVIVTGGAILILPVLWALWAYHGYCNQEKL